MTSPRESGSGMKLRMSDVRKGMRVQLAYDVPVGRARSGVDVEGAGRISGTVLSPKAYALKRPYEEGIGVRVKWDGFASPEFWHLADLRMHPMEWAQRILKPAETSHD